GATFFTSGNTEVAELQDAYKLLEPLLGNNWAPILFAVALIAAGQSSTVTGTLAGQIVMEGYLRLRISPWMRRLITRMAAIIPALLIVLVAGEESVGALLIFSQVLLSLQLGFAVIPLIHFVSDKKTMGRFVIKWYTKVAAWGITIILIFLNLKLVTGEMKSIFLESNMWTKYLLLIIVVGLVILLLYTFIFPLVGKQRMTKSSRIHKRKFILPDIQHLKHPKYGKIALALDFSQTDEDILSKALAQGYEQTEYVLIHITESASARTLGRESLDYETREDEKQLNLYIDLLHERGIKAKAILGHSKRAKNIAKIIQEEKADLVVMSGHGHTGFKDWLYGETVDYVRHHVDAPVLIV